MTTAIVQRSNLIGAGCAIAAVLCFSITDVGVKLLSDQYALHQVVLIRAMIGALVFLAVIMPFNGGLLVFRTRRPGVHLARGLCVVMANTFLFLGLASLPIADAVAVFFVSPLIITVFSVIILHEKVGPRRWMAIALGFIGVLVIIKPGTTAFQLASLFPIAAAFLYAVIHILARKAGNTESAATMTAYMILTFLIVSSVIGLVMGDGRFAGQQAGPGGGTFDFLLRAWGPVERADYPVLLMLGLSGVSGGWFVSQAYRLSEAAFAAPFEYIAMPMAVIWGITVFDTWPDTLAWFGIALIIGSGLYLLWREQVKGRAAAAPKVRQ
ncbi:Integral membrane protein [hydrothermal vent metagenome]|uniref:Integral membrane protein n=1 Tax=hydrothermal vent metagenome TaxID=652676 RepID=A0A3B0RY16_9ZZZZ